MIKIGNREIKIILSTTLLQMKIKTPHTQRIIEKRKVREIVQYQLDHIKKNKVPNFLGVLNIHHVSTENDYYLVDGQHRFNAIKELYNRYSHDLEVVVEIVKVKDREKLVENYNLINKNTPLPELPQNINRTIPEETTLHFQEKYPHVWSDKTSAKRPNVLFNSFQETLGYVTQKLQDEVDSSVKLIHEVEKLNEELSLWDRKEFKGVSDNMYQKAKQARFFLGLLSSPVKDEEGNYYEWGKKLVEKRTPPVPENTKSKSKSRKRKSVPKKVKNDSWDLHLGKECGEAYCIVCDITSINSKHFEAGHIISDKDGGKATVHNILPVCSGCNRSMGHEHMREYVRKNYPHNLERFDKRVYRK